MCRWNFYADAPFLASRPTVRKPNKSKELSEDFKTVADGRMVITELEDDKPSTSQKDAGMPECYIKSTNYTL